MSLIQSVHVGQSDQLILIIILNKFEFSQKNNNIKYRDCQFKISNHSLKSVGYMQQNQFKHQQFRIFISSTFRDMGVERDYLTKQIFPKVSKLAKSRGIDFTAIDLRWGVTKEEVDDGKVIQICLEEIDRCRPFFISLLGERYGWVPKNKDIFNFQELVSDFPIVGEGLKQSKSVTELEILHGLITENSDFKGRFYYRDLTFTQELAKQGDAQDYFENEEDQKEKLNNLKQSLIKQNYPIYHYHSLVELGEQVYQELCYILDEYFPSQVIECPIERQQVNHRMYATSKALRYLPNQKNLAILNHYLEESENTNTFSALLLTSESGLGKSALLSYWVSTLKSENPNRLIIEHYMRGSDEKSPQDLLSRLILEVRKINSKGKAIDFNLPNHSLDLSYLLVQEFTRMSKLKYLLIVIDAINQIDCDHLNWLPQILSPRISLVVSSTPNHFMHEFKERGYKHIQMMPLDYDARIELIEHYLMHYRKKLSVQQIQKIAQKEVCQNPLFLTTTLAELQIFGSFEKLDRLINRCITSPNIITLFERVIIRLENDYGKSLTEKTLCMIWASRRGLSEDELIDIHRSSRLKLSPLLLALEQHLMSNHGLLIFSHDYLRQAIKNRYFKDNESIVAIRSQLADWFNRKDWSDRKVEELPWLLEHTGRLDDLADLLANLEFFKSLYQLDSYELLHYWLVVQKIKKLESTYLEMLDHLGIDFQSENQQELIQGLNDHDLALKNLIHLVDMICGFLQLAGFYQSPKLIEARLWIFKLEEKLLGDHHLNLRSSICKIADLYHRKACYLEAEKWYQKGLNLCENQLGSDHQYTLMISRSLGNISQDKGNYDQAKMIFERNFEITQRILGKEHPDTMQSLHNMAIIVKAKGDYIGAKEIYHQVIQTREKVLGLEHPDTLKSINNLAIIEKILGKYDEAQELYLKIINASCKIVGADHPETITYIHNLGILKKVKGDYIGAQTLFNEIIEIKSKRLGDEHPSTLSSLDELASLLIIKGQYLEAETLLKKIIEIKKKVLGQTHNSIQHSLHNLGMLFKEKGNYLEAEMIFRKVLECRQNNIGIEHNDTLDTIDALGRVLYEQGKYEDGEVLIKQAIEIRSKIQGKHHPSTLLSQHNLATLLHDKGNYQQAKELYETVIDLRKKILGTEHLDTLKTTNNLAMLFIDLALYDDAQVLFEQNLILEQKILGTEHPIVLSSLDNIANLLQKKGEYEKAKSLIDQILESKKKVLGHQHPSTLESVHQLASILKTLGSYKEANILFKKVIEGQSQTLGADHPFTMKSMHHFAELLWQQGDYEHSEILFHKILNTRIKNLDQNHPDTLSTMEALAELLKDKSDYETASQLITQVIEIRRSLLGPTHPNTLQSMNLFARILKNQGDYKQAERLLREIYEQISQRLGINHLETTDAMITLGALLKDIANYTEAEKVLRNVLAIRQKILGLNHPKTLNALGILGRLLKEMGLFKEAENLLTQVLDIRTQVLGKNHPSVLLSTNTLGTLYMEMGCLDEAEHLIRNALNHRRQILGSNHLETLESAYDLSCLLIKKNQISDAKVLLMQVIEGRKEKLGPKHDETIKAYKTLESCS